MAFLMSFPFMFISKVGDIKFSIPQSFLPWDIGDKEAHVYSKLDSNEECNYIWFSSYCSKNTVVMTSFLAEDIWLVLWVYVNIYIYEYCICVISIYLYKHTHSTKVSHSGIKPHDHSRSPLLLTHVQHNPHGATHRTWILRPCLRMMPT